MSWISNLFKSRNKDPAKIAGETQPLPVTPGFLAFGINEDGTLRIDENEWVQAQLYDMYLARSHIHRIATEISKAEPQLAIANKRIEYYAAKYPNPYQSISQFLYQLATILLTDNNAFIIPIFDRNGIIEGLWPASAKDVTIVQIENQLWLQMDFPDGKSMAVEYDRCAHLKNMQYRNPLGGETNDPFKRMGHLYDRNLDRSLASVNDSALQWMGRLNATLATEEDIAEQQKIFNKANFKKNRSGIMVYDSRFDKVEQVKRVFNLLSADDIKTMQSAAHDYWGVSESIMQNRYSEAEWYAFYQSKIQPILIQIAQGLTKVVYTRNQIINGNEISLDRLQYSSVKDRIEVAFGTYDRGMTTMDDSLDILNLPPLPNGEGQKRYIRGEYYQEGANGKQKLREEQRKEGKNNGQPGRENQPVAESDDESKQHEQKN
ncbi:phage portal protein [Erysipelotrichaceae bacterium 66-17]